MHMQAAQSGFNGLKEKKKYMIPGGKNGGEDRGGIGGKGMGVDLVKNPIKCMYEASNTKNIFQKNFFIVSLL